ncbi:hypothetical protein GCM10023144_07170 [Pigmentiphaga soli]|uniref:Uncharacterized protein n=1 Tax=Pigmentiphaga soli TaxID=1007095 RepID=A0ABP8GIM4_9BURK
MKGRRRAALCENLRAAAPFAQAAHGMKSGNYAANPGFWMKPAAYSAPAGTSRRALCQLKAMPARAGSTVAAAAASRTRQHGDCRKALGSWNAAKTPTDPSPEQALRSAAPAGACFMAGHV